MSKDAKQNAALVKQQLGTPQEIPPDSLVTAVRKNRVRTGRQK